MHEFNKILPVEIDIKTIKTIYNQVIIEYNPKENETTASGIYTPTMSDVDTAAEHVIRKGTVVKVPKKLYYNREDMNNSMRWLTDIEIQVGDEVWVNHLTVNDFQYRCDGRYYKTIHYEDINAAKRGEEIIIPNGFVLLQPVYETKKGIEYETKEINKKFGIVAYLGSVNKEYSIPETVLLGKTVYRTDPEGLEVGDKVIFHNKAIRKLRYLEYGPYNKFDGNSYIIAQRHMIAGIID